MEKAVEQAVEVEVVADSFKVTKTIQGVFLKREIVYVGKKSVGPKGLWVVHEHTADYHVTAGVHEASVTAEELAEFYAKI